MASPQRNADRVARVGLRVGREAERGVRQKIISHGLQRGQEKIPEEKAPGTGFAKFPLLFTCFVMP
jgi:hypothetical protein